MTGKDSFNDYAYRAINGLLRVTAKAGRVLHNVSSDAIGKIDIYRLDTKLASQYRKLGEQVYRQFALGEQVSRDEPGIVSLRTTIEETATELEKRKESEKNKKR